jgi:hypothetical protein
MTFTQSRRTQRRAVQIAAAVVLIVFALGVAVGVYIGQDTCARPAHTERARVHVLT